MRSNVHSFCVAMICYFLCAPLAFAQTHSTTLELAKVPKHKNPLLLAPKKNSVIAIIPYYVQKNNVYVLLGQELTGGKQEKSGTFSYFGGNIKPSTTTVIQSMLYEFHKETLGQMRLNEEYVLKNSFLLYNKSSKDKDLYYVFVKFNEQQYNKTKKFNIATVRLKASSPPNSHFEKETFAWVSLDQLIQQAVPPTPKAASEKLASLIDTTAEEVTKTQNSDYIKIGPDALPLPSASDMQRFTVQTPQGSTMSILIRSYFLHDCLQDPKLPALLKQLAK